MQADILISGRREMLLLDVTPLSLGIETMGGVTSKIILRNSTIPASGRGDVHDRRRQPDRRGRSRAAGRARARRRLPIARAVQAARHSADAGRPAAHRGAFQIDANGILSVAARELRTGIEQTIEVKPSYGLTDGEVERMLIESFEHAEADFEARLLIEARNEAETVILATEKSLRSPDLEASGATDLKPGELDRIRTALADLKQAMTAARSRADSREDARAQPCDPAPGGSHDEPQRPRSAGREERERSIGRRVGRVMPKVTFIKDGKETIVEFEHGKMPYDGHGLPESFLDVAMNFRHPLEHACGGSCACTTCHLFVVKGEQNLSDRGQRARSPRYGLGPADQLAARLPGGDQGRCHRGIPLYTRNYVQEGGGIQLGKKTEKDDDRGSGMKWTDAEDIGIALWSSISRDSIL